MKRQTGGKSIYDGVLFEQPKKPQVKPQVREKKSFLSEAVSGPLRSQAQPPSSQVQTIVRKSQRQAKSTPQMRSNTHQSASALRQEYQRKVELFQANEHARSLKLERDKQHKIQLQNQRARARQERARELERQRLEHHRLYQEKISLQKQKQAQQKQEIIKARIARQEHEEQEKQQIQRRLKKQAIARQELARQEQRRALQNKELQQPKREVVQTDRSAEQVVLMPYAQDRDRAHSNPQRAQDSTEPVELPEIEGQSRKWDTLSVQGISLKESLERNNKVQKVETQRLFASQQKDLVQAHLPKEHFLDSPENNSLSVQTHKILTKTSDSFFENIPEATVGPSNGQGPVRFIKNICTPILSLLAKVIPRAHTNPAISGVTASTAEAKKFTIRSLFSSYAQGSGSAYDNSVGQASFRFATFGLFSLTAFGSLLFVGHAVATKDRVEHSADAAINKLQGAAGFARAGELQKAYESVENAHTLFLQANEQLSTINQAIVGISRYIPGASRLASGDALLSASVHISQALAEITLFTTQLDLLQKAARGEQLDDFSILEVSARFFAHMNIVNEELNTAKDYIAKVQIDDVPSEQRDRFIQLQRSIDPLTNIIQQTVDLEDAISELLGSQGARKYLFLFQNNQEIRASGGFIGSYGFLDIQSGRIREFKIDGIYNPDGQLTDKVVPPRPIQKISAAWSLHDSNWWPDFPKSAEKAMDFYARTGGPSVDGVIALTPVMIEKLLAITGPITLPEYDVTFTAQNFVEMTRLEIESEADKNNNFKDEDEDEDDDTNSTDDADINPGQHSPKKILSDLMPVLMGELKKDISKQKGAQLLNVVLSGLDERQVMIYMRNPEVRAIIEKQKWGGRLLDTQDDYLSVVHTNINGFKTDGVIDDVISHESTLNKDGSIIDRVTIQRTHKGGDTGREWWDAVNANYMRVYVPEGSRLLSATGHTPEWHDPRLDYETLGFEVDADVLAEESNVYVDPDSGTRVYSDSGKTVFGNWVYVSPGEKVTVTYEYELPWRFTTRKDASGEFSSHDVLYQKQAGVQNTHIKSTLTLDDNMQIIARIPDRSPLDQLGETQNVHEQEFSSDLYQGIVFRID